jgi:hypothetical protein
MAKLVWDPVTRYEDEQPIPNAENVAYKVYWRTPAGGYNNLDMKDAGTNEELDLVFLPKGRYFLAATACLGSLESVRSIDFPFANIPPATPSGLRIS